jgi:large subunit ribosomal protein L17
MRHYKRGRKLGTDASHTKAIKKSLVVNLFKYDRIKTTLERAKEIRGDADRIVTWAKRNTLHSRRLAIAAMGDKDLVAEVFAKVEQGLFEGREGGYTRIFKLGKRRGDVANMVIMELVQEPVVKRQRETEEEAAQPRRRFGFRSRSAETAGGADDPDAAAAVDDDEADDADELDDIEEADGLDDEADDADDADEAVDEEPDDDEADDDDSDVDAADEDAAEEDGEPAEEAE